MVFFAESSLPGTHWCDVISRSIKKKEGRGLLREARWREGEWAVLVKEKGRKKEYRSCKTEVNTAASI